MAIKMPEIETSGRFLSRLSTRLRKILIRHREPEHVTNIDNLLNQCPNADEAVLQWARANVANIAIGYELQNELGADDPTVRKHRARIQREVWKRHRAAKRNTRRSPYAVPTSEP